MKDIWQLQDAKSKFSELVERAIQEGVQVVTRHGQKVVVVMSYNEYEKMTRPKDNLAEFLLNSPFASSEITIEKEKSLPRDINLDL